MSIRRWFPFILLNIFISAAVVLAILFWWDKTHPPESEVAAVLPTVAIPTAVPINNTQEEQQNEPLPVVEATDPNYPIHSVAVGDTLGAISVKYDVAVSDIQIFNGLSDEDFIFVGQALKIPLGGLPTATPLPTTPPLPTNTPAPIQPTATPNFESGEAKIEIAEVTGMGELAEEQVLIVNSGSQPLALQGWTLRDAEGHIYTFGQWTLFGDGAGISIHTMGGNDQATDLYWGQAEAIWQPEETVILRDAGGDVRSEFIIP